MIITLSLPTSTDNFMSVDFDVEFYHEGGYPATPVSPKEPLELVITSVKFVKTGREVPDEFFELIFDQIEDKCNEPPEPPERDYNPDLSRTMDSYEKNIYDP